MAKVVVTGSSGFIGRNLVTALRRRGDVSVACFDSTMSTDQLPALLDNAQIVYHLAGVNRPETEDQFEAVNVGLTRDVVELVTHMPGPPLLVLASSTQAELDNPYGRSKRAAENLLIDAHDSAALPVCIYRLPGVFGKWSRPNYNTVVATFCHNIAHAIDITIDDPAREIELAYVDEVVSSFLEHLDAPRPTETRRTLKRTFRVTLGELAERIATLHDIRNSLRVPDFSDELTRCLYSTYLSFLTPANLSYPAALRTDDRGWLFELLKSDVFGQIFVSTTHPGVTRGNHYHDSKVEKFCLIRGRGIIRFRDLGSDEVIEYPVDDQDVRIVDIAPGYTHSIENVGETEMIVLFWANEVFDPANPDTYPEDVIT